MTPLRLIILVVGIIIIVAIYIWESLKQRKQQRRQTVKQGYHAQDQFDIRKVSKHGQDGDFSGILAELNQPSVDSGRDGDDTADESFSVRVKDADQEKGELPETHDMFPVSAPGYSGSGILNNNIYQDLEEDQIVTLHITALSACTFNGNDIRDAVNNVGLEYGDMNIFHHHGIGDMQSDRPLFSLADMFEPGYFDLANLDKHNTRGLTLFLCLPASVDNQVVFELMLNTAQRLARRLGGEVRGPDHKLLDEGQIAEIRKKINTRTFV